LNEIAKDLIKTRNQKKKKKRNKEKRKRARRTDSAQD
jgi:hypothetical protein